MQLLGYTRTYNYLLNFLDLKKLKHALDIETTTVFPGSTNSRLVYSSLRTKPYEIEQLAVLVDQNSFIPEGGIWAALIPSPIFKST
jgi:hypothetical protein